MLELRADRPFQGRGDAGQGVAEAIGVTGRVRCEIDVEAVEDPELDQQVVIDAEPVDLVSAGAGGVRDDVRVAPVGLRVARVEVGGSSHHEAGNVRDGDLSLAGQRERELRDRAGLVDHQPDDAVLGGGIEDLDEIRLAVRDAPVGENVAAVIKYSRRFMVARNR